MDALTIISILDDFYEMIKLQNWMHDILINFIIVKNYVVDSVQN